MKDVTQVRVEKSGAHEKALVPRSVAIIVLSLAPSLPMNRFDGHCLTQLTCPPQMKEWEK